MQYKCHFYKCNKVVDSEKQDFKFIRIQKGLIRLPNGKKVIDWEGYRPFCLEHVSFIFKKKLKHTLALVFGIKKKKTNEKK